MLRVVLSGRGKGLRQRHAEDGTDFWGTLVTSTVKSWSGTHSHFQ